MGDSSYCHMPWDFYELPAARNIYFWSRMNSVTQRSAVTRFEMTFRGNSLSSIEISGPWPLGQANLDTPCMRRAVYVCSRLHNRGRFTNVESASSAWTMAFKCKTTTRHDPLKQSNSSLFWINREWAVFRNAHFSRGPGNITPCCWDVDNKPASIA